MSKGLEALERLKYFQIGNPDGCLILWDKKEAEIRLIEKELKALEIIKEKQVNIKLFFETIKLKGNAEMYNKYVNYQERRYLTQEEYDLLREILL